MDRFAALVLTVFQRVLAVQIGLVVVGSWEPGHYSADSLLRAAVLQCCIVVTLDPAGDSGQVLSKHRVCSRDIWSIDVDCR